MAVQNYGAVMQGAADLTAMPANAFLQAQAQKQAMEYRNAMLGMDQQRLGMDQQQYADQQAAAAAQGAQADEDDAEWDDAFAKKDWARMARVDPQTTKILWDQQQASQPKAPEYKAVGDSLLEMPTAPGQDPRVAYQAPHKPQAATKPGYGAPQVGLNPATGKPEQYVVDDYGQPKFLGISPVPTTQESTAQVASTKKAQSSKDVLAILDEAEPIISQATGSYGGYVADQAARIFGASTDGAKATAKLKALQAALMLKMPRMEGPQSNLDVQLYREAAGQIGDPTVPADTKLAAVQSIRSLNEKYAGVEPSKPPGNKPKPGDVVKGYRFKGGDPSKKENWVKQ
jgi:hypothetical protein